MPSVTTSISRIIGKLRSVLWPRPAPSLSDAEVAERQKPIGNSDLIAVEQRIYPSDYADGCLPFQFFDPLGDRTPEEQAEVEERSRRIQEARHANDDFFGDRILDIDDPPGPERIDP